MSEKVACPKCGNEFECGVVAVVPDSQRFTMKLTLENKHITADVLGELLSTQAKLMREVANGLGSKVATFIEDLTVSAGEVSVDFLIVDAKPKRKA